jgi:hypothetical protein
MPQEGGSASSEDFARVSQVQRIGTQLWDAPTEILLQIRF